jgi:phosphoribosylformylglycinamidine cyclo-ligase
VRRVFNLGIGFAAVVSPDDTGAALRALERGGGPGWICGEVTGGGEVELR